MGNTTRMANFMRREFDTSLNIMIRPSEEVV